MKQKKEIRKDHSGETPEDEGEEEIKNLGGLALVDLNNAKLQTKYTYINLFKYAKYIKPCF